MTTNPWVDLPEESPFVLHGDAAAIARFNARANERHRIRLDVLPEPFIGRPDAPLVLLNRTAGSATPTLMCTPGRRWPD